MIKLSKNIFSYSFDGIKKKHAISNTILKTPGASCELTAGRWVQKPQGQPRGVARDGSITGLSAASNPRPTLQGMVWFLTLLLDARWKKKHGRTIKQMYAELENRGIFSPPKIHLEYENWVPQTLHTLLQVLVTSLSLGIGQQASCGSPGVRALSQVLARGLVQAAGARAVCTRGKPSLPAQPCRRCRGGGFWQAADLRPPTACGARQTPRPWNLSLKAAGTWNNIHNEVNRELEPPKHPSLWYWYFPGHICGRTPYL